MDPTFDYSDLSASSREIIYRYLSDASEKVPTEIGDAILDTYNDLRDATQVVERERSPGQATTSSISSPDDFVAGCVPGPLVKEPIQFNVSHTTSMSSRHSAASEIRSLRDSVSSRRSLGGKTTGVKKSDSVIDPDSPLSLKRLSAASYSSLEWYSPSSPLRYSFSANDSGQDILTIPTKYPRLPGKDRVDLGMQMDGAGDDDGPARRQQYPAWLTAKAITITPIKRPRLQERNSREDFGMQMDSDSDSGGPSNLRELEDAWMYEHPVASTSVVDHQDEVGQNDHRMSHLNRQQDEAEQDLYRQLDFRRPQSYATTIFTEADSIYDGQEGPFRRGRDNDSHFEADVDVPDPDEAPHLPQIPQSTFLTKKDSSNHFQDETSTQAPTIQSFPSSDDGKSEVAKPWPREIKARQKAERDTQQNSFEMQKLRRNHPTLHVDPSGEYHDERRSVFEPPPPSPTEIDEPRQGDFTSRIEQALRRGTPPMSPQWSPAQTSSHSGQVSSLLYSPGYDDDRQTLTSPRPGLDRPGTRLSEMPTMVNSEYPYDRPGTVLSSTVVDSGHQPYHSYEEPISQARTVRRDSTDSSNGLKYNDRLPKMRMSRLNHFLVVSDQI